MPAPVSAAHTHRPTCWTTFPSLLCSWGWSLPVQAPEIHWDASTFFLLLLHPKDIFRSLANPCPNQVPSWTPLSFQQGNTS